MITIVLTDSISTEIDFVSYSEIKDAEDLARARVHYFRSLGWYQFSTEELFAEACYGISEAICRFNPGLGTVKDTKFTSYAYFWIDKRIQEYIARNKTMLSGNLSELWTNEVPYTQSFDAIAENPDNGGIDHIYGIRDNDDNAEESMIHADVSESIKNLVAELMSMLDPFESTCYRLSFGIGTVSGEPMQPKEIAKSMNTTIEEVLKTIDNVSVKLREQSAALKETYTELYS